MKNILFCLFVALQIPLAYYIYLPLPQIPNLPNSVVSTEPGDTVQLKNVRGFFTNSNRQTVLAFFDTALRKNMPFVIRINHPPEYAKQIFRDTMQSYYLVETVFPLKGSVFINGYEWANDVFTKPEKREKNKLIVDNVVYQAKITTRTIYPSRLAQMLNILFLEAGFIFIIFCIQKSFSAKK